MEPLKQATFTVTWHDGTVEDLPVPYNPAEMSFSKGVQVAEIPIPGLDSPLLQFVRGQNETMTLDLFFDSTEKGMGTRATSVTKDTDKFYQLVQIEPAAHAPPICKFTWNTLPGADVSEHVGNQKRDSFQCIVESVRHKYTLFSPEGVPLRATLSLTLREYKTLEEQLNKLNLNQTNRTQGQVLQAGDTLSSVAGQQYRRPGEWRQIADANGIEDPRRLTPGAFLTLPPR